MPRAPSHLGHTDLFRRRDENAILILFFKCGAEFCEFKATHSYTQEDWNTKLSIWAVRSINGRSNARPLLSETTFEPQLRTILIAGNLEEDLPCLEGIP